MNYDSFLFQVTEAYNQNCNHYTCETGRQEVCKRCETYCTEYMGDLDLIEIQEEAVELLQVEPDSGLFFYAKNKLKEINKELLRRSEKKEN